MAIFRQILHRIYNKAPWKFDFMLKTNESAIWVSFDLIWMTPICTETTAKLLTRLIDHSNGQTIDICIRMKRKVKWKWFIFVSINKKKSIWKIFFQSQNFFFSRFLCFFGSKRFIFKYIFITFRRYVTIWVLFEFLA